MAEAQVLVAGEARGPALVLERQLGFWGGVDETTGVIIDVHHPQRGERLGGCVLVVPRSSGSTAGPVTLAETVRRGVGPAAVVLGEPDQGIVSASVVVRELYDLHVPVVVLPADRLAALRTGVVVEIAPDGAVTEVADG